VVERDSSVSDKAERDEGEKSKIENRENDSSKRIKDNAAAGGA
jgi:hypothetical protein